MKARARDAVASAMLARGLHPKSNSFECRAIEPPGPGTYGWQLDYMRRLRKRDAMRPRRQRNPYFNLGNQSIFRV